jgi:transposase
MVRRHELTDAEWARVAPLLPPRETRGTYYKDHRRILNGMLYRLCTGCGWRDLPERYGPWSTVASRLRRWTREGRWDRILAALQRDLDAVGQIDWELWCIDGTHVRAHRVAAGAGKKHAGASAPRRARRPRAGAQPRRGLDEGPPPHRRHGDAPHRGAQRRAGA